MNQIQIYMPPPINWQDFQILIAEVAKVKYVSDSVQEYGRQGQAQYGIDIYATDIFDKSIGIQCKETKTNSLTTAIIDKEILKVTSFKPALNLFIIATTNRIDAKLQKHINQINIRNSYTFKIQLWFWDDINQEINRSRDVMLSSYSTYLDNFGQTEITNHLNALKLTFGQPAFIDDFSFERNYDDFEMALVSIKAMLKTGFLYDNYLKQLIIQVPPSSMIGDKVYQNFIVKIENNLEKLYQVYLKDKDKQKLNPKQLIEKAGEYNIQRKKIILILNKEFKKFKIGELDIQY